jgi:nitroreductase
VEKNTKHEVYENMSFFDLVESRVSVRQYKSNPVPKEDLLKILNAARLIPNSGNQQACRFLVVQDRDRLDSMKEACIRTRASVLRARGDPVPSEESLRKHYDMIFSAPLYVLVLVDKTVRYKGYEDKDGSLAASHIMLGARALGYGTVFYTDSIPEAVCMEELGIPEKYSRTCIIPIGVPEKWPDSSERKPLEELVFYEKITD